MRPIALALILLASCRASGTDIHLSGKAGEMFRRITGASAITINDKVAIYGTAEPATKTIVCHEEAHKRQAKVISDVLVEIGAIDDDAPSRTAAWIGVYSIDYLQRGYANNRFEIEARALCGQQ